MSSIVGRWVGSAPILKTPRELQSEGPPPAFDDFDLPSKDHAKSLLPRNFDFCIPNPARAANDRHVDERTYQKLLQYFSATSPPCSTMGGYDTIIPSNIHFILYTFSAKKAPVTSCTVCSV